MKSKKRVLIELIILALALVIFAPLVRSKIATLINNQGADYYNIGEAEKAISFFKLALKIKPTMRVYCNLANAYREQGRFEESITEYKRALQRDPNCIEAIFGLADNYHELKMYKEAMSYLQKAESFGADGAKEELENLRYEYSVVLFNEAAVHYTAGNPDAAEEKLKELIDFFPNFFFAYKALGDIQFSRNLFAQAIANYQQAIELGIQEIAIFNLYNDIGISYVRLGDYEKAVEYLRKAHLREPNNLNILFSFACVLRDNRNTQEALEKFQMLSELKPDFPNLHNELGDIYFFMDEKDRAEREYEKEIKAVQKELSRGPRDTYSCLNRLALAYYGLQEYKKAEGIINGVIEENPDYGEAFFTRAKIYEKLEEFDKVAQDLEKAKGLFSSSDFIDSYIFRLETKRVIPEDEESFRKDTIIYLKNGRQLQGRLRQETKTRIHLDLLVGSSFGTVVINRDDIDLLEKIK